MKSFKSYISEHYNFPVVSIEKHNVNLDDPSTLNELNKNIDIEMSVGFTNLGDALNKAKKVLSMYGIELDKVEFNDEKTGSLRIPFTTAKSSGESHKKVTAPFGEFNEHHIFKFDFNLVDGVYKISAEVVEK